VEKAGAGVRRSETVWVSCYEGARAATAPEAPPPERTAVLGYVRTAREREALGIPLRPFDAGQVRALCALLVAPPPGGGELLLGLLRDRVSPGVGPGARLWADFLGPIARGELRPPLLTSEGAVALPGTMMGGDNAPPLLEALEDPRACDSAVAALLGRIPSPSEYLIAFKTRVVPRAGGRYRPLPFDAAEV